MHKKWCDTDRETKKIWTCEHVSNGAKSIKDASRKENQVTSIEQTEDGKNRKEFFRDGAARSKKCKRVIWWRKIMFTDVSKKKAKET